jgi:transcriptional regulator with XRE-family HTH domain
MTQADDLSRLTSILVRELALTGRARQVRFSQSLPLSELGKAAGATADQVGLWEEGRATPSTPQALAWLSFLYEKASWREAAGQEASA